MLTELQFRTDEQYEEARRQDEARRLQLMGWTQYAICQHLSVSTQQLRTMLNKAEKRVRRHRRLIRWHAVIDEAYKGAFAPHGQGRPIDMGGPRDVWIDYDPWDRLNPQQHNNNDNALESA